MRKKKRMTFGDLEKYETKDYYKDRRILIEIVEDG